MLNRPSRTQNEEIVPVGRGEREQRWTLEEESQHCIFPEVIPPRWTHVKRSEQQGSMDSQGANQRDFSIPGNQEIPVKGSWRNTQKRFTKKGCAIGCHHPRLFCRLLSPSLLLIQLSEAQAAGESKRRAKGEQARAGLRGEDSKFQAGKKCDRRLQ